MNARMDLGRQSGGDSPDETARREDARRVVENYEEAARGMTLAEQAVLVWETAGSRTLLERVLDHALSVRSAGEGGRTLHHFPERGEPVMVVGSELGATLFDDGQALGRELVADFRRFLIVGVLEPRVTRADEQAFVPAGFLRENYRPSSERTGAIIRYGSNRNTLRFTVADRALVDEARTQVTRYFDATYGQGTLNVTDPRIEARAQADRYQRLVRVILFLALSALLIATLNMSNIFSSRALRRRRSAGILKAMGATGTRVFVVFLFDALTVGAVGSAAGVGLAVLMDRQLAHGFGLGGLDGGLIVAGVATSWVIVAACSVVPAVAAARPPAADTIRYE